MFYVKNFSFSDLLVFFHFFKVKSPFFNHREFQLSFFGVLTPCNFKFLRPHQALPQLSDNITTHHDQAPTILYLLHCRWIQVLKIIWQIFHPDRFNTQTVTRTGTGTSPIRKSKVKDWNFEGIFEVIRTERADSKQISVPFPQGSTGKDAWCQALGFVFVSCWREASKQYGRGRRWLPSLPLTLETWAWPDGGPSPSLLNTEGGLIKFKFRR